MIPAGLTLDTYDEGERNALADAMEVMTRAFDPLFGEAWTLPQLSGVMTMPGTWLTVAHVDAAPLGFALVRSVLDECELRDTHEDGGVVRCKRQDLTSDEIQQHMEAGKQVTQLSLAWQDKLSFVLDDKLIIKRLRFEELLQDQAEQDGGDDALAQQDASFLLMMMTFREFLPALFEAFGGEEVPQGI